MLTNLLESLGRLFYLVPISKTTFADLESVPNYVAETIPMFVLTILVEIVVLAIQNKGRGLHDGPGWEYKKFRINDMVGSIGAGILQQLSKFFLFNIGMVSYLWVYDHFHIVELDVTKTSTWVLGFLCVDLAYYWFHRAAHEVNIFWAAHVVHHSSEYYNQTTALRQSIFQIYTSWMFDCAYAFFLPPPMFAVHRQFNTLFQYWIHTEVIGNLGPLEYIINTPSAHRVHHGRNPYCIDKNFAGTLIIWDIIFGTFELEMEPPNVKKSQDVEHVAYGLTHPINTFDPITIQTHHYVHVFETAWSTPRLVNKFKVFFYGPGWHDDTPRTGLLSEIPVIPKDMPPPKYDPYMPPSINAYVVIHFMLVVATSTFILMLKTMPYWIISVLPGLCLWSLTTFGWLFDHVAKAPLWEAFRVATIAVTIHGSIGQVPEDILQSHPTWISGALILQVLMVASAIWMMALMFLYADKWHHASVQKQKRQ